MKIAQGSVSALKFNRAIITMKNRITYQRFADRSYRADTRKYPKSIIVSVRYIKVLVKITKNIDSPQ